MVAMSSQPVMLGMVIVNLAMIGMLWYTLRFAAEARKNELGLIFTQQREMLQMMANCAAPAPPQSRDHPP
jgi:Tfp pilus assembly protein PilV